MSQRENTETEEGKVSIEDLSVSKEELERNIGEAVAQEIKKAKDSYHYTIVVSEGTEQEDIFTHQEHRVFLDSNFDIPRKRKRDNWVSEEKEAFNHFYSIGFDSFQSAKKVSEKEGDSFYLFVVGDDQVRQSIEHMRANWVTVNEIRFLTDYHSIQLESVVESVPSLLD